MLATMQSPSCLLYGPLDARFEDRPIPKIQDPHDVIVRIAYTGVCGSDVHFWLHGGIRTFVSESQPLTMGHEASGTVHAIGTAVTTLTPGDRVAIEPGYSCRHCEPCKTGRYNLCPKMKFAADPPRLHGTLAKYFRLPADFCYKIPNDVSLAEAVLVEPLAVGMHAVKLADVKPGQRVLVFGAGTVGLLCGAVAREFGAATVLLVDLVQRKLDLAKEVIGDHVAGITMADPQLRPEYNARRLLEMHGLGNGGVDVVIDASGAEASVQTAMYVLRSGGTYVQVGLGKRKIEFPIAEICERELNLKGSYRYGPGDFALSTDLVARRRIRLQGLISRVFPFESATEAWETARRGEGMKILIEGPKS